MGRTDRFWRRACECRWPTIPLRTDSSYLERYRHLSRIVCHELPRHLLSLTDSSAPNEGVLAYNSSSSAHYSSRHAAIDFLKANAEDLRNALTPQLGSVVGHTLEEYADVMTNFAVMNHARWIVREYLLNREWKSLLDERPNDMVLRGAILICHFDDDDVNTTYDDVAATFDGYAERVKAEIRLKHGSTDISLRHKLEVINEVLYEDLKFQDEFQDYYSTDNSFITKVLQHKAGIPITMSIVYLSVASRLGISCGGLNAPGHFLTKVWSGEEEDAKDDAHEQYFIDAFDGGRIMTAEELQFFQLMRLGFGHGPVLDACSPIVLLRRMMANLFSIYMRSEMSSAMLVFSQLAIIYENSAQDPKEQYLQYIQLECDRFRLTYDGERRHHALTILTREMLGIDLI